MKLSRALIFGDCHYPYADKAACKILLDIASELKHVDDIIINGDFYDCFGLSRFLKNPVKMRQFIEDEFVEGKDYLEKLEKILKAKRKYFIAGNHEERIEKVVFDRVPLLARQLDTKHVLGLSQEWNYLPYGQKGHVRLGPLIVTHGCKTGVGAARANLLKYGTRVSVLTGHVHRSSSVSFTNYDGKTSHSYTIGGLWSKEAMGYITDSIDGNLSFAIVEYNSDIANVNVIQIENGRAIYNEKIFTG